MGETHAKFNIDRIDVGRKIVWIVDLDGPISVTNDAEAVCRELNAAHPAHRIFYRDTEGFWDELVHQDGRFIDFRLLPERVRAPPLLASGE